MAIESLLKPPTLTTAVRELRDHPAAMLLGEIAASPDGLLVEKAERWANYPSGDWFRVKRVKLGHEVMRKETVGTALQRLVEGPHLAHLLIYKLIDSQSGGRSNTTTFVITEFGRQVVDALVLDVRYALTRLDFK